MVNEDSHYNASAERWDVGHL